MGICIMWYSSFVGRRVLWACGFNSPTQPIRAAMVLAETHLHVHVCPSASCFTYTLIPYIGLRGKLLAWVVVDLDLFM